MRRAHESLVRRVAASGRSRTHRKSSARASHAYGSGDRDVEAPASHAQPFDPGGGAAVVGGAFAAAAFAEIGLGGLGDADGDGDASEDAEAAPAFAVSGEGVSAGVFPVAPEVAAASAPSSSFAYSSGVVRPQSSARDVEPYDL